MGTYRSQTYARDHTLGLTPVPPTWYRVEALGMITASPHAPRFYRAPANKPFRSQQWPRRLVVRPPYVSRVLRTPYLAGQLPRYGPILNSGEEAHIFRSPLPATHVAGGLNAALVAET